MCVREWGRGRCNRRMNGGGSRGSAVAYTVAVGGGEEEEEGGALASLALTSLALASLAHVPVRLVVEAEQERDRVQAVVSTARLTLDDLLAVSGQQDEENDGHSDREDDDAQGGEEPRGGAVCTAALDAVVCGEVAHSLGTFIELGRGLGRGVGQVRSASRDASAWGHAARFVTRGVRALNPPHPPPTSSQL